jgi:CHASE2 domain-containing sensor protein
MTTPPAQPGAAKIIRGLMIAIVVWGAIIAAGAWTLNHDVRRPLVVMACVLGFLGFWLAMLRTLRRPT